MDKKLVYILFFILFSCFSSGIIIEKGTVMNLSSSNTTITTGKNITVGTLSIYANGVGFDIDNLTIIPSPIHYVNITSFNFTSNYLNFHDNLTTGVMTIMDFIIKGQNKYVNFSFDSTYSGSISYIYNGTALQTNTSDTKQEINVSSAPLKMEIVNIFDNLWVCDGRTGEIPSINFTILDEDLFLPIVGNIYVDVTYMGNVLAFQKKNISSLVICKGGGQKYIVSGVVRSEVSYIHKYFLQSANFSNVLQTIVLYNINDSSDKSTAQFTIRNTYFEIYRDVIGKLERYYPDRHAWITVQQDISDEFGRVFFHIKEINTDYRIKYYNNDQTRLLKSTNSMKFICSSGLCEATQQLESVGSETININPTWSYSNATKILTVTWNDITGATSYVRIQVIQRKASSSTIICNSTIFSSAGTYFCNMTGYYGTAMLTIDRAASPETRQLINYIDLMNVAKFSDYLPMRESIFSSIMIMLVVVGMGAIGSPAIMILTLLASLGIIFIMNLTNIITLSFLGVAFALGLAIAIKIGK